MPYYTASLLAPILTKLGLRRSRRTERVSDAPDLEAASSTSWFEMAIRPTRSPEEHTPTNDPLMRRLVSCYDALKHQGEECPQDGPWDPDMEKGPELLDQRQLLRTCHTEEKEEEEEAEMEVEAEWEDEDVKEDVEIVKMEEDDKEQQQPQQQHEEDGKAQRQRLHQANEAFKQSMERLQHLAQQMKRDMFERAAERGLEHLRRVEADLAASLADPQACIEAHLAKWATTSAASSSAERQQSIREEVELILANPEAAMQRVRGTLEEMAASRRTFLEDRIEEHDGQEEQQQQQQRHQKCRNDACEEAMLKAFDDAAHIWRRNPTMLQRVEADRALYEASPQAWNEAQDAKYARWWDQLKPEERSCLQKELDAVKVKYRAKPNSSSARFERRRVDAKAVSVVLKRENRERKRERRRQEEEVERERLQRRAEWAAGASHGAAESSTSAVAAASTSEQDATVTPVAATVTPVAAAAAAAMREPATPSTTRGRQGNLRA